MNANTVSNALAANNPANAPVVQSVYALSSVVQTFSYNPSTLADGGNLLDVNLPVVLDIPNSPSQSYTSAGVASGVGGGNSNAGSLSGLPQPNEVWSADGRPFLIRVNGKVAPITGSGVLHVVLMLGDGVTGDLPAAAKQVPLASAATFATLSASNPFDTNFNLEAECMWDSTSSQLNGYITGTIAGTLIALTAFQVSNVLESPLRFTLGASLSLQNSNAVTAPATITLVDFSAERL